MKKMSDIFANEEKTAEDTNMIKIWAMVQRGESEIDAAQLEKDEKAKKARAEAETILMSYFAMASLLLPEAVRAYLTVDEEQIDFYLNHLPLGLTEFRVQLKIPHLAPIRVEFIKKGEGVYFPVFRVAHYFVDEGEVYWSYRISDPEESLEIALAWAKDTQLKYEELEKKMIADREQANLVYEDVDGSEPVPDLILINNLRNIIREEIDKRLG
jgi:hypothetical protein